MFKHRTLSAAVFAVLVGALVGGRVRPQCAGHPGPRRRAVPGVHAALAAIETQYVEKVESDRVVYSAIQGMVQTLDPHSNFLDPRTYAQLRERQEGRYYGLGITIQVVDGDITVVALFEGSPAYKQGHPPRRRHRPHQGRGHEGLDQRQGGVAAARARRDRAWRSALRRQGYDQLIALAVERDEISIPTIQGVFMIDAHDRLRPAARLLGDDRPRPRPRHRDAHDQGHEAAAARPARQPRRARSIRRSAWPTGSCPAAT